jgi:putative ABC transport system permease protein
LWDLGNDSTTLTVIGVVKNFYLYGFWAPLEPIGIRLKSLKFDDDGTYSFLIAKTNINDITDVYNYLETE